MATEPTTLDRALIEQQGFQVVPYVPPEVVDLALEVVDDLGLGSVAGFYASIAHGSTTTARPAHLRLAEVFEPHLRRLLGPRSPVLVAVTTKGVGDGTDVKFHTDWTYTDERRERALLVWTPLVDVGTDNGCLHVVPGSHRWTDGLRAGRGFASPAVTEAHQGDFAARAVPLPMKAGFAVVFDPALLHGSGPNRSERPRPAVTSVTVPDGADLFHFHEADDGAVTGAQVDIDYFTVHPYGQPPEGFPPVEPWTSIVSEADYEAVFNRSRRRWFGGRDGRV